MQGAQRTHGDEWMGLTSHLRCFQLVDMQINVQRNKNEEEEENPQIIKHQLITIELHLKFNSNGQVFDLHAFLIRELTINREIRAGPYTHA